MAEVICVDPQRASGVWSTVAYWLAEALERGGNLTDFATLERQVLDGKALLWLACTGNRARAAAVTTLATAGRRFTAPKKFCTIVACGGSRTNSWRECIRVIEEYARAEGCHSVVIQGRRGWSRVLPGYYEIATIIERRL